MAARRLVVVMLVLLAISTLATALLPRPDDKSAPAPTTTTKQPKVEPPPSPKLTGLLLVARMNAAGAPKTVRIERGDELRLEVEAPFGADVEIPGYGLVEPVTPFAPASFDFLATDRGTFPVRVFDPQQLVGRVLVGKPDSGRCGVSTPATPEGRAPTRSCRRPGRHPSRAGGRSAQRP